MKNNDLRNLSTKDKMLIMKTISDLATAIYKDNTNFILNQIIKNGKYQSNYGQFYTRTNERKTVEEIINKKKEDLKKLQEEIKALEELDKNEIIKEETTTLMSKHTAEAENEAMRLLTDLLANLDSKRLNKAASKR